MNGAAAWKIDMNIEPAILGGLVTAPCDVRDGMALPAQFGFTKPPDQRAQIRVVQEGNIIPGNFEHGFKLGKRPNTVNHR